MKQGKFWFAFILLSFAVMAGVYVWRFLVLLFLEQRHLPLTWSTYFGYYQALDPSAWAPLAKRIKLSGAIGFGLPLLAWIFALLPLLKRGEEALHGDARFADHADLEKAGLLTKALEGLLLRKAPRAQAG